MLTKLRAESLKLWRKPRTYMGFAGMLVMTALMMLAVKYGKPFEHVHEQLASQFIVSGTFVNAEFLMRYLVDAVVYTFLPLFTCLVLGDLIASENADGTLRMLLCRPASRLSVAASKYLVGVAYVIVLTVFTALAAFIIGWVFLGHGSLLSLSQDSGVWIFPEGDAILRLAATYGLVAVGMLAVGSIAYAISTFLSNSLGAVIGTMGLLFAFRIIQEIEFFKWLKPYLFTTYYDTWQALFVNPIDVSAVWKSVAVLLTYAASAFAIGLIIFQRRDVLS